MDTSSTPLCCRAWKFSMEPIAIHGLGASGGIINLITKRPTDKFEQSIRVDSTFQTQDVGESADYGVTYSLANRFGNADVLASLSYRQSGISYDANGEVIGADNTQGDTMDSRTLNAFLKTGYGWDDQRIELMFNRYDIEGNNDWISVPGNVAAGVPTTGVKGHIAGEGARNKVTNLGTDLHQRNVPRPEPARPAVQPGPGSDLRCRGDAARYVPGSSLWPEPDRPIAEQFAKAGPQGDLVEARCRRAADHAGVRLRRADR